VTRKAERLKLLRQLPDQKPAIDYTTDEHGTLVIDKPKDQIKPKKGEAK
tara:strand:+ start:25366 stop:25512 length:147 start_codon:yes stop_codon:yes gene_type:complete